MQWTLALFKLAALGGALAGPNLPGRQLPYNKKCARDGCLGSVIGKGKGLADCQSYFKTTVTPTALTTTSVSSITTGSTTTITQFSLSISTITTAVSATTTNTITVTSTSTATSTVSTFLTTTATGTSTVTSTYTATITPTNAGGPNKRSDAHLEERGTPRCTKIPTAIPSYAGSCAGPAKYSSVCSCLGATASTSTASAPTSTVVRNTTITNVAASTVKSTSTTSTTVTNAVTQTATSTITSSATITSQTTITGTSTVTSSSSTTVTVTTTVLQRPTCTSIQTGPNSANPDGPYNYAPVYVGFNTLSPSSPANADSGAHPMMTTSYPGTQSVCTALANCALFAYNSNYFTFNLYFVSNTQSWTCAAYYDYSIGDGSDFSVSNSNVEYSYGYSLS